MAWYIRKVVCCRLDIRKYKNRLYLIFIFYRPTPSFTVDGATVHHINKGGHRLVIRVTCFEICTSMSVVIMCMTIHTTSTCTSFTTSISILTMTSSMSSAIVLDSVKTPSLITAVIVSWFHLTIMAYSWVDALMMGYITVSSKAGIWGRFRSTAIGCGSGLVFTTGSSAQSMSIICDGIVFDD